MEDAAADPRNTGMSPTGRRPMVGVRAVRDHDSGRELAPRRIVVSSPGLMAISRNAGILIIRLRCNSLQPKDTTQGHALYCWEARRGHGSSHDLNRYFHDGKDGELHSHSKDMHCTAGKLVEAVAHPTI
jgi:hypothetical protein